MIGIIADDVTGATDVAAALTRRGTSTMLMFDPLLRPTEVSGAAAVVVGLKTRTAETDDAVSLSLRALDSLRECGATRFYFKYCSTFDSTQAGNIGPITDALADALGVSVVVTTPSAPRHGRTVYRGHLFVGDTPLAETHMAEHPLTPMTDSSVLRLLQAQTRHDVTLIGHDVVGQGENAVRMAIADSRRRGVRHLVSDTTVDADLTTLAAAVRDETLVAGSAGLVEHLVPMSPASRPKARRAPSRTVIIAGSCSQRTLEQIDRYVAAAGAHYRITAHRGSSEHTLAADALKWFDGLPNGPALFFSSRPPVRRASTPGDLSGLYERTAGQLARGMLERGIRRLIVAGGETSGAVIDELGVRTTTVEEEVAPGVPWLRDTESGTALLLKSGNFGPPEMFAKEAGLT
ncbi:3-oxo-tetronate kinase [Nonomuraea angiospora]|uniref:3-oxo-tetronate kinase n=1 Tax=Nonomuraea angiospora TaxID=46172 RepID=UPI0029BE8774|nr:3-oxo-tetronate kinase [Nonomuraea angiospora]MDX3100915.1 four-carbon acid sugar kinase family protein [Nonomuraea angiospora]